MSAHTLSADFSIGDCGRDEWCVFEDGFGLYPRMAFGPTPCPGDAACIAGVMAREWEAWARSMTAEVTRQMIERDAETEAEIAALSEMFDNLLQENGAPGTGGRR